MRPTIAALKARLSVAESPYLRALHDGSMSREDFVETQIQFLFAVVFFSRPMSVLAGRLPRPELRLPLLGNVRDEHGSGDLRFSHERTFLELLGRLGVGVEDVERRALWPEVRTFNTTLAGLCTLDDTLTALAALGMIEDLFSGISASIGEGLIARGWLQRSEIVHYATHETLDVDHAEGFYQQLDAPWASHARHRYQIEQGLELGAYVFLRMYEDLWRARGRRWLRDVRGPHSLADGWYLEPGLPT
ncbi:iron-containing redox enzyme family protein [Myxococcota bacterium]|nr:iron-containing redox enzyme family protein [Myxococcota bacterium]